MGKRETISILEAEENRVSHHTASNNEAYTGGSMTAGSSDSIKQGRQKDKGVESVSKTLEDITSCQDGFAITVRVVRLFTIPRRGCHGRFNSSDLIVVDEKGEKIHVCIKESLMNTFTFIQEGETYEISNYSVAFNSAKLRFVAHKYKIIVSRDTIITSKPAEHISQFGFTFADFSEINGKSLDEKICVDVIGVLVGVSPVVSWNSNKEQKMPSKKEGIRMKVELMDLRRNVITCVFWDSYTELFTPYIGCTTNDAVVVIVQLGKYGIFNSNPQVSNGFDGTKLFIDDCSIDEINDFKERFKMCVEDGVTISHISSDITLSTREIFLNQKEQKRIKDIHTHLEETGKVFKAVTLASIEHIDERNGWYYNSCRSCKRKVTQTADENNKFWCKHCKVYEETSVPSYCIQFTLGDESGICEATLFDTSAAKFLNKSVTDILDMLDKDADFKVIPDEVNDLLNTTMLFRLDVSDYNIKQLPETSAYTISRISGDKELIVEFENLLKEKERDISKGRNEIFKEESKEESSDTPNKRSRNVIDVGNEPGSSPEVDFSTTKRKIKEEFE